MSKVDFPVLFSPAEPERFSCSFFFTVALGGWLVTFMMRVRQGDPFASGMTAVGFWLGLTIGRVVLGFVTGRIGEKVAVTVSITLS